jgi:hypothetical protein
VTDLSKENGYLNGDPPSIIIIKAMKRITVTPVTVVLISDVGEAQEFREDGSCAHGVFELMWQYWPLGSRWTMEELPVSAGSESAVWFERYISQDHQVREAYLRISRPKRQPSELLVR